LRGGRASALASLTGIVNGTTNVILSQMHDGTSDYASALADAQRRSFAEPDPSKDVQGIDSVEADDPDSTVRRTEH
jgi:homoserine dehydrogenase